MKHNVKQLQLQDLFIGAWVQEYLEIPKKLSTPMYVESIFESGDIYLDFEENEADPFEAKIENIRGIPITTEHLLSFHFKEVGHDVYEIMCDGFAVVAEVKERTRYPFVRIRIEHDGGGYQINDNILFIHQMQKFVFDSTRKPLILKYDNHS